MKLILPLLIAAAVACLVWLAFHRPALDPSSIERAPAGVFPEFATPPPGVKWEQITPKKP